MTFENRLDYQGALRDKGYSFVGDGYYSAVFAPPTRTVVKVGPLSDGWLTYIAWAVKHGYAGNIAPRVKSIKVIHTENARNSFYVAEVERLEPLVTFAQVDDLVAHDGAFRSPSKVPERYQEFVAGIQKMKKNYRRLRFDLHSDNFMQRANGEIVVTDPLAGKDAESGTRAYRSLSQTLRKSRTKRKSQ